MKDIENELRFFDDDAVVVTDVEGIRSSPSANICRESAVAPAAAHACYRLVSQAVAPKPLHRPEVPETEQSGLTSDRARVVGAQLARLSAAPVHHSDRCVARRTRLRLVYL